MKMKEDKVLKDWKNDETGMDKKFARRIVWRTRLSLGLTVLRTLFVILFLYILYIIPVSIYYHASGKEAEFDRLVTTLVETRHPAISVDKSSVGNTEINPLLTQHTTLAIYKKIGDWEVIVGEVTARKMLFGKVSYTIDFNQKYLNLDNGNSFAVSPDLLGEKLVDSQGDTTKNQIREQLNMVEDGFVAQIQFSTKESMSPEGMREVLEDYDVNIQQMPVYGGELTEVESPSGKAGQFTFVPSLMLTPALRFGENSRSFSSDGSLSTGDSLDDAIDQFIENMDWLIETGNYRDRDLDKQRLEYMKENGVKVFGATVTGPVREVEKLIEEDSFHQFYLGGIEVWNWHSVQ
ncbi:anti sigma factor C-terminal domain-containing protein [Oceanobacillus massiliensis]|uniref:anti sigma factor C-terminal domain-containing protein n=2 Tax=Oceanobacillus massiliensis TaxID=1465765 RepID=UPI00028892A3|nr:anti sigma factor C-terminal domain-containing protein [Oceanobacillus massiliensis]